MGASRRGLIGSSVHQVDFARLLSDGHGAAGGLWCQQGACPIVEEDAHGVGVEIRDHAVGEGVAVKIAAAAPVRVLVVVVGPRRARASAGSVVPWLRYQVRVATVLPAASTTRSCLPSLLRSVTIKCCGEDGCSG